MNIGSPTPNNNVYILDEHMVPVPIGRPGVMWAGGAGITRGYVDLPDKTAERYKIDPFTNDGYVGLVYIEFSILSSILGVSCSIRETWGDGVLMAH